jgi:uncharacterized protein
VTGSAFVVVSFQNAADAPASREDVQRWLDAMHTRDMTTKMMDMMATQTRQIEHAEIEKQKNLPPDFEAKMDKMMDDMFKNFPIDDLWQVMIPVYQRHFTKGDMDAFVVFYSSPTGQKLVRELPAVTAESMHVSQGIMQKMMARVMQRVQDQIAQMQKQNDGSTKNK